MYKKKIVIASILKPVNDTRMYEKMGLSLAKTNKYDVNIIGFSVKNIPVDSQITFHPLFSFQRLSLERILAPWKALRCIRQIRPDTLIINTHELLLIAAVYRLISGVQLIYDVRENYCRNILYTKAFPILPRPFLALWVRFKEYLSQLFVSHYFLAESGYKDEFSFAKQKATVLENKYQLPINSVHVDRKEGAFKLLFSGTLAESTGVFHAIRLAKALHELEPSVTLEIIGYTPISSVIDRVRSEIAEFDFITLTGGNALVSHDLVISKIQESNFGIICYPYNKSTVNSTPTKLYEYLANRLPIVIQDHPKWKQICGENEAGIIVNFELYDPIQILYSMQNQHFYPSSDFRQLLWSTEVDKMLAIINS